MELVIPQWAVYLCGCLLPAFGGAVIWVFLRQNENATKIAVNIAEVDSLSKQLTVINDSITSARTEFKDSITGARVEFQYSFDKLEKKFDTFLAGELQFFKEQYKQKR